MVMVVFISFVIINRTAMIIFAITGVIFSAHRQKSLHWDYWIKSTNILNLDVMKWSLEICKTYFTVCFQF
jgi:hypothetical protein